MYSREINRLAEEHSEFIMGLLKTTSGITIETCKYLCKEVFKHAWKHAEEKMLPKHGRDGRFIRR